MFINILKKLYFRAISFLKAVVSERHRFITAVILSIICHITVLIFAQKAEINASARNAIILTKEEEEEKRLEFEIVETQPENVVENPPEDAKLASDKNTQARDNNPMSTPKADRPVTAGIAETKELPFPEISMKNLLQMKNQTPIKEFSLERLLRDSTAAEQNDQKQEKASLLSPVMPKNQKTSPKDIGGFTLSTYSWNFAPYMLELKRKINNNIYPPMAFTELGIIQGNYVIRFVITRSGELKSIQVLDSKGAKSLELTSCNAIKYSRPFKPLPDDFPDEVLVVTGNFYYYVR